VRDETITLCLVKTGIIQRVNQAPQGRNKIKVDHALTTSPSSMQVFGFRPAACVTSKRPKIITVSRFYLVRTRCAGRADSVPISWMPASSWVKFCDAIAVFAFAGFTIAACSLREQPRTLLTCATWSGFLRHAQLRPCWANATSDTISWRLPWNTARRSKTIPSTSTSARKVRLAIICGIWLTVRV
jgi:hypothetical protein